MSRKKDIERAKRFCYRSGEKVPAYIINQKRKEEEDAEVEAALAKLGLVKGKADIVVPSIAVKNKRKEGKPNVRKNG